MKHSNIFNLYQFLTTGCFIHAHRNDIAVAQSGCSLYKIHSSSMTTEWKLSSLLSYNTLTFTTLNSHLATRYITTWETSSPNSCAVYVMYSFILIAILLLFRYLIFIPRKVCTLPFMTFNPRNLSYTLLMRSSITSCSICENLLSSTYQSMLHYFPFMYLLATHMS